MGLIQIYAAVLLVINLINTVTISVKVSGLENIPEKDRSMVKLYSRSAVISFFATLPIYLRAVGLL